MKHKCIDNLTCSCVNTGCNVLQDYLRCIPKSLLREELFDDWIEANGLSETAEKTNKLKE